jgi:hypothetical protein
MKVSFGHTITFDRDRYHQQEEMISWCNAHIGLGTWWTGLTELPTSMSWALDCLHGRTTFWFDNDSDALLFALRWS